MTDQEAKKASHYCKPTNKGLVFLENSKLRHFYFVF